MGSLGELGSFSLSKWSIWHAITQRTVCQGMLWGLGSDVIKPSCSVCFCKVKTNTSMSIWTQLWYFYLPHQLQAAIIISSLMKLMQHLASSCLFASEQTEGHLVHLKQTGSSWERCLHLHLHMKAQSCLSPHHHLSLHDNTEPGTAITSSPMQYSVSHTTKFELTVTLGKLPLFFWCLLSTIRDRQQRFEIYIMLFFRQGKWERYQ